MGCFVGSFVGGFVGSFVGSVVGGPRVAAFQWQLRGQLLAISFVCLSSRGNLLGNPLDVSACVAIYCERLWMSQLPLPFLEFPLNT